MKGWPAVKPLPKEIPLSLTVNGRPVTVTVDPTVRLLDLLREKLFLTGTKEGCGKGECGACTVFVNGKPIDACLMLAAQAAGAEVVTIEGLAKNGVMDAVQEGFVAEGASQCGFCIPGFIMAARSLLDRTPTPTLDDVKLALAGNLCRCTGYTKIFAAVLHAAKSERERNGRAD